jgi:hypothetical protein
LAGISMLKESNMDLIEEIRFLTAIVCALVQRAGGELILPAQEIAACDSDYQLSMAGDWRDMAVMLAVRSLKKKNRDNVSCFRDPRQIRSGRESKERLRQPARPKDRRNNTSV